MLQVLYIFQVYTSESGGYRFYRIYKSIYVRFIYFNIKDIDVGKNFKSRPLPSSLVLMLQDQYHQALIPIPFDITATKFPLLVYLYTSSTNCQWLCMTQQHLVSKLEKDLFVNCKALRDNLNFAFSA